MRPHATPPDRAQMSCPHNQYEADHMIQAKHWLM